MFSKELPEWHIIDWVTLKVVDIKGCYVDSLSSSKVWLAAKATEHCQQGLLAERMALWFVLLTHAVS